MRLVSGFDWFPETSIVSLTGARVGLIVTGFRNLQKPLVDNFVETELTPQHACVITLNTSSISGITLLEIQMADEFRAVQVRFSSSELAAVDDWRRQQEGEIPSRSTAIRFLTQRGMPAKKREPAEQAA
jgi:hypothetical protein